MLHFYIDEFLIYCTNLHYADNSIKELIRYVDEFNKYLTAQQVTNLSRVKFIHLLSFITSQPSSPHTVKARIWAIKKFINFLHLHEYIKDNISKDLSPPRIPQKETTFLTQEELKTVFRYLIKNINKPKGLRDFIIISIMATLGLRKSSVIALSIEDFDSTNQRIFVEEKGVKGKRPILIPFALLILIEEYILKMNLTKGPLFLTHNRKRLRAQAIDKIVVKIKKSSFNKGYGFANNLYPHIFRHSAATELNNIAGFDITREILGPRNEKNTRKYIHLSPLSYGAYMRKHPYFNSKGDI